MSMFFILVSFIKQLQLQSPLIAGLEQVEPITHIYILRKLRRNQYQASLHCAYIDSQANTMTMPTPTSLSITDDMVTSLIFDDENLAKNNNIKKSNDGAIVVIITVVLVLCVISLCFVLLFYFVKSKDKLKKTLETKVTKQKLKMVNSKSINSNVEDGELESTTTKQFKSVKTFQSLKYNKTYSSNNDIDIEIITNLPPSKNRTDIPYIE